MKPVFVIAGVAVAGVIVAAVVLGMSMTPDFDTIIENQDCDAIMGLTNKDLESATPDQQSRIEMIGAGCPLEDDGDKTGDEPAPPEKPVQAPTPTSDPAPAEDIPSTISMRFDQDGYDVGTAATVLLEQSVARPENIRLRVTDSAGTVLHEDNLRSDNFGTASSTFTVPQYYAENQPIEAVAIFEDSPNDKYTAGGTIHPVTIDLGTDAQTYEKDSPVKISVRLSSAISENVNVRVSDGAGKTIHDAVVTTDDFGVANTEFVAPAYYFEEQPITIAAAFAKDLSKEREIQVGIKPIKATVKMIPEEKEYRSGERITFNVSIEPPTAVELKFDVSSKEDPCYVPHPLKITTGSDGKATFKITQKGGTNYSNCADYWNITHEFYLEREFNEMYHLEPVSVFIRQPESYD